MSAVNTYAGLHSIVSRIAEYSHHEIEQGFSSIMRESGIYTPLRYILDLNRSSDTLHIILECAVKLSRRDAVASWSGTWQLLVMIEERLIKNRRMETLDDGTLVDLTLI